MDNIRYSAAMFIILTQISCSSSNNFLILKERDKEPIRTVTLKLGTVVLIGIDSNKVDTTMHDGFSVKFGAYNYEKSSFWKIKSADREEQVVTFENHENSNRVVSLRVDQIKYLVYSKWWRRDLLMPFGYYGLLAPIAGLVFLPIPDTPIKSDLTILGSGVISLGIAFGVGHWARDREYEIIEIVSK